jgi:trk system potassium uptake protein TrkH
LLDLRPIFSVNGVLLVTLGTFMFIPALFDVSVGNQDWVVFVVSAGVTIFLGVSMTLAGRQSGPTRLSLRQAFLLTTLAWVIVSAFAALPIYFSEFRPSYAGAYFEAMSALTTTGSTVLVGLDTGPPGILMWRALLQGLGGIGIIVLAISVLPMLQIGGMQLFRTESSDRSEKLLPRTAQISGAIITIYVLLVLGITIAFALAGMTLFDAFAHALPAISTGGFSTKDASIGFFKSAAIEWVAIVGMLLGSLPFLAYLHFLRGKPAVFFRDRQIRVFIGIIVVATLAYWLYVELRGIVSGHDALRWTLFNVVTIISTTGFVAADYTNWGPFSDVLLFIIMFLGACSGSTAGGIKTFRWMIAFEGMRKAMVKTVYPSSVIVARYQGRTIDDELILSVYTFIGIYVFVFFCIGLAITAWGYDWVTAFSATIACLSNVGPGLGPIVGPAGNFKDFPDAVLWLLSFAMLVGRLELFTVLVLLLPRFWRG